MAESPSLANGVGIDFSGRCRVFIDFSGRCRVGIEPGTRVEHVGSTKEKILFINHLAKNI